MNPTMLLRHVRETAALATASFHEHRVLGWLLAQARELALDAAQDRWGNLHVRYRRGRSPAQWTIVAHTDHPGFVVTAAHGRRATGRWFGRVLPEYFAGARIRITSGGRRVNRGRVRAIRLDSARQRVEWITIETETPAAPGQLGCWDFPGYRRRGDRLHLRAADDLVGCALLSALLESLARSKTAGAIDVVFTRAEEAGLLGASAMARAHVLPADHAILSIETSRAGPVARIGAGPVLRVGDRMAVFDPGLGHWLHRTATELTKSSRAFRFQRALMDGGTCEASSFAAWGYRTAGLAIPLGNYHNMGRRAVAPEVVSVADLENALAFLEALATHRWPARAPLPIADRPLLEKTLRRYDPRLRATASAPPTRWIETSRSRRS